MVYYQCCVLTGWATARLCVIAHKQRKASALKTKTVAAESRFACFSCFVSISLTNQLDFTKKNNYFSRPHTVFFTQSQLSAMEKNTSKCKICLFWYFQHGEKREKGVVGHESDKLIEQYSAQPTIKKNVLESLTIEQQFESSSIIRRFITLVNSGQINLFLQMGLIISSTFSF